MPLPVLKARLYQAVRRQGLRLFSCSTGCFQFHMHLRTQATGPRRSRRLNLEGGVFTVALILESSR